MGTTHFGFFQVVHQSTGCAQLLSLKSMHSMFFHQDFLTELLMTDGTAQGQIPLLNGDAAESDDHQQNQSAAKPIKHETTTADCAPESGGA